MQWSIARGVNNVANLLQHRRRDPHLKNLVASHAFAIVSGRSALAADAVWQLAEYLGIPEPGQRVLSAANLDDLKEQLADRGYQLVEVRRHG